jgi:hypothetical protein
MAGAKTNRLTNTPNANVHRSTKASDPSNSQKRNETLIGTEFCRAKIPARILMASARTRKNIMTAAAG